jgi:hypothetical protein
MGLFTAVIPVKSGLGSKLLLKLLHGFILVGRANCFGLAKLAYSSPSCVGVELST